MTSVSCPKNYKLSSDNSKCIIRRSLSHDTLLPTSVTCPKNYFPDIYNRGCNIDPLFKINKLIPSCPTNYTLIDDNCNIKPEYKTVSMIEGKCPKNYIKDDSKCIIKTSFAPDNVSKIYICEDSNYISNGSNCVIKPSFAPDTINPTTIKCNDGYSPTPDNSRCLINQVAPLIVPTKSIIS